MPEPHTTFTVVAGFSIGMPAASAAWRAGFCPTPVVSTLPIITSSTASGATPVSASSALMATAPSCGALTPARLPKKLPMGVRLAATMTTCFIFNLLLIGFVF